MSVEEKALSLTETQRNRIVELIADLEECTAFLKKGMTTNRPRDCAPYEWAESIRHIALTIHDHMMRACAIEDVMENGEKEP